MTDRYIFHTHKFDFKGFESKWVIRLPYAFGGDVFNWSNHFGYQFSVIQMATIQQ